MRHVRFEPGVWALGYTRSSLIKSSTTPSRQMFPQLLHALLIKWGGGVEDLRSRSMSDIQPRHT